MALDCKNLSQVHPSLSIFIVFTNHFIEDSPDSGNKQFLQYMTVVLK